MSRLLLLLLLPSVALAVIGLPPVGYNGQLVNYPSKDALNTILQGFLVKPPMASAARKYPAVIVFHAFTGRTEFENQKAVALAKLGYVAFAADTYGKGNYGNNVNENFGIMGQMLGNRTTLLKQRVIAAWNYVNSLSYVDKTKIGTIGYCYGGLCSLDLARFDLGLKAAVSFHGTLTNYPGSTGPIRASIQAHHGDLDIHTTNNDTLNFLDEMRQRSADWVFSRYSKAEHAFTLPAVDAMNIPGASYNKLADQRSWEAMKDFLAEKLQC